MVQETDMLVARSPAHFVSDIQRVKTVCKPELADLTDVVVFPRKGNVPLVEKLSGGDYDGDLAWVCWDPRIVENFQSAEVQQQPDLSRFMPKDKETFSDLLSKHPKLNGKASLGNAVAEMMAKSFAFNLSKSMLGVCTNYKERLCYKTIRSETMPRGCSVTLLIEPNKACASPRKTLINQGRNLSSLGDLTSHATRKKIGRLTHRRFTSSITSSSRLHSRRSPRNSRGSVTRSSRTVPLPTRTRISLCSTMNTTGKLKLNPTANRWIDCLLTCGTTSRMWRRYGPN